MDTASQMTGASLARHQFVRPLALGLTTAVMSILLVSGCALLDPSVPCTKTFQHALHDYAATSRPARWPTTRRATQTEEGPLTLANAIKIALHNNPDLAAAGHGVDAAEAQCDVAVGAILPKVNLEGGYTYFREERLIKPRRPGTLNVLGFTDELITGDVVLTMPLYTGGRLRIQITAAELIARSRKQQLVRSRTELVFNVSSVFYSMLGHQEVINSMIFSRKALQEHHKLTKQMLDAQKAARVDLLRTEVRLADIEQQIIRERNTLNIKRFYLAALLGVSREGEPLHIDGTLGLTDVPARLGQGLAAALANRQDYQAAKSRVEAQEENLAIAESRRLPELALRASYGNRWAADAHNRNEVGQVGVLARIPLFEGGQIGARVRGERSRLRAEKQHLRKLELRIRLEVETATLNIESTRARVGVTQKAAEQAKESLRIEREKYDLGKGAIVDVLDAQAALLNSQTHYYRALADYNTALAQFRLAEGKER